MGEHVHADPEECLLSPPVIAQSAVTPISLGPRVPRGWGPILCRRVSGARRADSVRSSSPVQVVDPNGRPRAGLCPSSVLERFKILFKYEWLFLAFPKEIAFRMSLCDTTGL